MAPSRDAVMQDAAAKEEDEKQYNAGSETLEEIQVKYPNRQPNEHLTLCFADLFQDLFDPLNENKTKIAARGGARFTRSGVHGATRLSPHEQRRQIIERFISRWRNEVGNDFYPALRLILPDKDRDRGVYGLKESNIGKLLVKLMGIDKDSEDGYNLIHWKLPGKTAAARLAGDFAGRCYEILAKRPMRTKVGDMRIGEVNILLDELAGASGEAEQLPIFEVFYKRMNAKELMWLIRIVLKQMKVGASEKTILDVFHPEGEKLFSVSSSLRRVCWELWDPKTTLEEEEKGVTLMNCFMPQLAAYSIQASFDKIVTKLLARNQDQNAREYWIEEKLDGERMQLHMIEDEDMPGGKRFAFWSRKAKEYTKLYGEGFEDNNSSLTRHLKDAFLPWVKNIILDGEMITWDPTVDKIVAFGTLKTAAIAGQRNPFDENATRPVFRVFDILYINDKAITNYELESRRKFLSNAIKDVPRRLEIQPILKKSTDAKDIEPELQKIVASSGEGLVLKNPLSSYHTNRRNDDWIKVKPEYMSEFGELFDCVVIGGYYGTGRRGGILSSYLCGLRVDENRIAAGADPEKCLSFFKVGGGFRAEDYAEIRHRLGDKWTKWDASKPPSKYIELGGGERLQHEKPDVWIRPSESLVLSVKAAQITPSNQFALGLSLRFPRLKRICHDKNWDQALTVDEFEALQSKIDTKAKEMVMEGKKRKSTKRPRRELIIAGQDSTVPLVQIPSQKQGSLFEGLTFCILSEGLKPVKKSKAELEALVKEHGGTLSQKVDKDKMILIGDKKVVKVASLIKYGGVDIIKSTWLFDCIAQSGTGGKGYILPYEPRHIFHATEETEAAAEACIDMYGDSYFRDVDIDELQELLTDMPKVEDFMSGVGDDDEEDDFMDQLEERGHSFGQLHGRVFQRCHVHLACSEDSTPIRTRSMALRYDIRFGGGTVSEGLEDGDITHVVIVSGDETARRELAAEVRASVSSRMRPPRVVLESWVEESVKEKTLLDEEAHAAPA